MSRTSKNGAQVILDLLEAQGTDCIFASPIAAMAPVWEALAAQRVLDVAVSP
jgi:acetolactate synthase-1/2/3 large subunit